MSPLVLTFALLVFLAVWLLWLAMVLIFPGKWTWFVDWEHDFFLRRGWLTPSVSRALKRLETGLMLKLALAGTILLGSMSLVVVIGRYFLGLRI